MKLEGNSNGRNWRGGNGISLPAISTGLSAKDGISGPPSFSMLGFFFWLEFKKYLRVLSQPL